MPAKSTTAAGTASQLIPRVRRLSEDPRMGPAGLRLIQAGRALADYRSVRIIETSHETLLACRGVALVEG
jgi:hypothetical protein